MPTLTDAHCHSLPLVRFVLRHRTLALAAFVSLNSHSLTHSLTHKQDKHSRLLQHPLNLLLTASTVYVQRTKDYEPKEIGGQTTEMSL